MKKIIFLFAILLGFASCQKEAIEPAPSGGAAGGGSYDKYVVIHQTGLSLDSLKFVNTTAGTSETVAAVNSTIDCGSTEKLAEFPLSSSPSVGDNCTITIYHNGFTFGGVAISDFLANASTVLCDELGGNSGNQLSSGTTTVLNFTVD